MIEKTGLTDQQQSMLATATRASYNLGNAVPAMVRSFPHITRTNQTFRSRFERKPENKPDSRRKFLKDKVRRWLREVHCMELDGDIDMMDVEDWEVLAAESDDGSIYDDSDAQVVKCDNNDQGRLEDAMVSKMEALVAADEDCED